MGNKVTVGEEGIVAGAAGGVADSPASASAAVHRGGSAVGLSGPLLLSNTAPPFPRVADVADHSPAMDAAATFLAGYLARAHRGESRVVLFGDFDVDGTSSAAILYLFAKLAGISEVMPYVSRRKDGYGLTKGAITRLVSETSDPERSLVVLMDLGVSSTAEATELLSRGYSVIVIDHHVPKPSAKKEWAEITKKYGEGKIHVYDPLLCIEAGDRQFSCLSAAGLVYKLCLRILDLDLSGLCSKIFASEKITIQAGCPPQSLETVMASMAKICAIAQAADCMPFAISGKVTAAWLLAKDFEQPTPLLAGIKVLYEKTNTASRIGWVIGPILNAAGRLEDAYAAFELLVEVDETAARAKLLRMEEVRKKVQTMTKNAQVNLENDLLTKRGVAVLVANPEDVKAGVAGIAAARAADYFKAPALYMTQEFSEEEGVIYKGSMRRGPTTFSCEEWILGLKESGIAYAGGGHPAAAGVAIRGDQLEALVAHAESQMFDLDLPPHYDVSVEASLDYQSQITDIMPFGRGHESAVLNIRGYLTGVRPLRTKRDNTIWTYILTISDFESAMPLEVKAMAGDLDEETTKTLDQLAGKSLNIPTEVKAVVHDGFQLASRYARSELRVTASADGVTEGETTSGKRASVRFLSKSEFKNIATVASKDLHARHGQGQGVAFGDMVPAPAPLPAAVSVPVPATMSAAEFVPAAKEGESGKREDAVAGAESLTDQAMERVDFLSSPRHGVGESDKTGGASDAEGLAEYPQRGLGGLSADELAAMTGTSVTVHVDWNDSVHRRVFMLRRPSKLQLEESLGLEGLETLSKIHGGRWSDKLKCYLISSGVISSLLGNKSEKWRFAFSPKALAHWAELKAEFDEVDTKKADSRPFTIPYFKEGGRIQPLGFQYADVRLYMERRISLCHNDMGTGKTFEAGAYAALRHCGAVLDENRNPVIPEGAVRRPVLFVTLKTVLGQFAAELAESFDLSVTAFTTGDIRDALVASGEIEGPKDRAAKVALAKEESALAAETGSAGETGGKTRLVMSEEEDSEKDGVDRKLKPIFKVKDATKAAFFCEHIKDHAFVVTTPECLARHPWIVSSYEWSCVVVDEAHEFKSPEAFKTKAIFGAQVDGSPLRHGSYGTPILALSGTFAKNRPCDWFVWVRMVGADGGIYTDGKLDRAQLAFNMRFNGLRFKTIRMRGGVERRITESGLPENGDELKIMLTPFVVRRLKTEIADIPPIDVHIRRVPSNGLYFDVIGMLTGVAALPAKSHELLARYGLIGKNGELKSETVKRSSQQDDDTVVEELTAIDPASLAGKLSLISSLDKASGIIKVLRDAGWLTPNAVGKLEPFVVMAFHQCAAKEIARQLELEGVSHYLMMMHDNSAKREEKKVGFQAGERTAFVTTFGTGGTGLNLTKANRMVIANLPWTDTSLAQGRDRIFRLGQDRPTEVMILLQMASVDEATFYLLQNKGRANFRTIAVDKLKGGKDAELPSWATGSVMDHAKSSTSGRATSGGGKADGKAGVRGGGEGPERTEQPTATTGFRRHI